MTPAELKVLRESLGLSAQWIADRLGVDQRTVRRWEDGALPIRADVITLLHELDAQAEADADEILDQVIDAAGLTDVSDAAELAQEDWATIEVPRVDTDVTDGMPAAFHRAVAARVRWELGGALWLEYPTDADDGTIECACGRRGTWVLAEHDQRSKPFPPPGQLGDEIPVFITHSDRTQHRMHHGRVTE